MVTSQSKIVIDFDEKECLAEIKKFREADEDGKHFKMYTYKDGSKYEGQWRKNKRDGKGIYKWKGGFANYIGEFKKDKKHGYGKMSYGDGASYTGAWFDDKRNGDGHMIWPDQS